MRSRIPVTRGQLDYEFAHLKQKLAKRNPALIKELNSVARPKPNALFRVKKGPIAKWESQ